MSLDDVGDARTAKCLIAALVHCPVHLMKRDLGRATTPDSSRGPSRPKPWRLTVSYAISELRIYRPNEQRRAVQPAGVNSQLPAAIKVDGQFQSSTSKWRVG